MRFNFLDENFDAELITQQNFGSYFYNEFILASAVCVCKRRCNPGFTMVNKNNQLTF